MYAHILQVPPSLPPSLPPPTRIDIKLMAENWCKASECTHFDLPTKTAAHGVKSLSYIRRIRTYMYVHGHMYVGIA